MCTHFTQNGNSIRSLGSPPSGRFQPETPGEELLEGRIEREGRPEGRLNEF